MISVWMSKMSHIKSVFCRFCAKQKLLSDTLDLSTAPDLRLEVIDKLSFFHCSYIDFADKTLPETVCTTCYDLLNETYNFFIRIKMSQIFLMELNSSNVNMQSIEPTNPSLSFEEPIITIKVESNKKILENFKVTDILQSDGSDIEMVETGEMSWRTYPWICRMCDLKTESMDKLREHSKHSHKTCYGFQCADCDTDISDFTLFIEHVKGHRTELKNYCHHCNDRIKDGKSDEHMTTHTCQPSCKFCGKIFLTYAKLRHHLLPIKKTPKQKKPMKLSRRRSYDLKRLFRGVQFSENIQNIESWKDYPWICRYCSIKFPNENVLRSHAKEIHRKCFGMQCADCTSNVDGFMVFVDHVRMHRPNLKYFCQFCDYKFENYEKAINHITDHLTSQKQCEYCGEMFHLHSERAKHLKIYEPPKTLGKKDKRATIEELTCDICQKVVRTRLALREHINRHMNNKEYTCERCGKAFFTKGWLREHMAIHKTSEPQICEICNKSFLTVRRLKEHVATHYADRPFECEVCHKNFRLRKHLKGHMITHSDSMPFPCQYCEKAFRFKTTLRIHENQHTGARPYSCSDCQMKFTNWSNCNKHMIRKHGKTLAKTVRTPQGKMPVNPSTGKPEKVGDLKMVKQWTENLMQVGKRGKRYDGTLLDVE